MHKDFVLYRTDPYLCGLKLYSCLIYLRQNLLVKDTRIK
jgi:hypothetical protein